MQSSYISRGTGVALLVVVVVLVTGCPLPLPAQLTLTASFTQLTVGESADLTVTSTDPLDTSFEWSIDNAESFTLSNDVAGDGVASIMAVGEGAVVVTARGLHSLQTAQVAIHAESAEPEEPSHAGRFSVYAGSKTCNGCHSGIAADVHASVHYQWNAETPYVTNMETGGKLTGMNDFCTSPGMNFIGLLTNLQGQQVSGGCAQCHVGMGALPTAEATTDQLENIDCLICHSDKWKRKVVKNEDGSFVFSADEAAMAVPLLEAITDITLPTDAACVKCHAYAGGGHNNKRGDIEAAHANAPRDFDVHMAAKSEGGAGLSCTSCHVVEQHRFAGRGVDLRATDLDIPVTCDACHTNTPHASSRLNNHTSRVYCTVCHIPEFARGQSTEMFRDFSAPDVHEAKQLWEPTLTRESNVVPEYRFYDGTSYIYTLNQTVAYDTDSGLISMAMPMGDINTPGAKIHAFKLHGALQPIDIATDVLVPLKMGIYFQTANVDTSVTTGASLAGISLEQGYEFVQTERYMGIYHEVAPSEEALGCSDCHADGGRLDFAALGYTPKMTFNGKPLCAACHGDRSGEFDGDDYFYELHEEHAEETGFNCSACHDFEQVK